MTWHADYVNLFVALALGLAVGWERSLEGKAAGYRTHALVAVGAAGVVLAARMALAGTPEGGAAIVHVVAGVITGIGFLGAGSIIQSGHSVRGLTTAASIWVVAAIGIAAGGGEPGFAVALTLMTWIVLRGFRAVESAWLKRHPRPHPHAKKPTSYGQE